MKTVLKKGERHTIVKSGSLSVVEGIAELVKPISKNYGSNPPYEVWDVKFDDDEIVRRMITVKLSPDETEQPKWMLGGSCCMSSSYARSSESDALVKFMKAANISIDWADPVGHGITAWVTGNALSNEIGAIELNGKKVNNELLLHLEHNNEKVVVNLNTLLVLATSYIKQQYDVAKEALRKSSESALPE